MQLVMSLLILGAGLINNMVNSDTTIPTREEQANLLTNVQEMFEQVKLLVKDEAGSTDISVVHDIELLIRRAEYTLDLLEKVTLLRLSCDSNSVCMLDYRHTIGQLGKDGRDALRNCSHRGSEDIRISSNQLANVTNSAIDRGQLLLDDLNDCSRKSGLTVISCYRNIIATDVLPVKRTLLGGIEAHRIAHFKAVEIRNEANECVDNIVRKCRNLLENALKDAVHCI